MLNFKTKSPKKKKKNNKKKPKKKKISTKKNNQLNFSLSFSFSITSSLQRLHPVSYQGREAGSLNVSNEKTPIVSPDMPDGCHEPRSDTTPQAGETCKPRSKQAIVDTAVDYGADFIVDDYSDSVDPSNIVHKHSKLDFQTIGDLFDDADFG